jgi:hypothetical protein
MVVHPDDDDAGVRGGPAHHVQPLELGSEHRVVEDDHSGPHPAHEADQICQVGRRPGRLDARLRVEQAPERRADPLIARCDDDRHRRSRYCGGLLGHGEKHRRDGVLAHPQRQLNRRS